MPRIARSAAFFRVWNPAMAYTLGLWWADGCMRVKRNTGAHEIQIASNDRDLLIAVGTAVGEKYDLRKVAAGANTYVISFCSVEMYHDIESHGGTPRKSLTIGFPEVPSALLAHYLRGVVDGDGTLTWNDGDRPILQVYSGSPIFLHGLVAAIEEATGIPAPKVCANRANWCVKWSTVRAQCLASWLYSMNPGLALERKAAIAVQFREWRPRKTPNQGTITERMRQFFPDILGNEPYCCK